MSKGLSKAFSKGFSVWHQRSNHREPEHFISNKNKCTVIHPCSCVFFELFRSDLMALRLCLKFQVTLLMHGHYETWESLPWWELIVNDVIRKLRRHRRVIITKLQKRYVNQWELIVNDVTRNLNCLRFIQIPFKRLRKDTGTQVNNSTLFIFVTDKMFGLPVVKPKRVRLFQKRLSFSK